jgi:hypothetical protein
VILALAVFPVARGYAVLASIGLGDSNEQTKIKAIRAHQSAIAPCNCQLYGYRNRPIDQYIGAETQATQP